MEICDQRVHHDFQGLEEETDYSDSQSDSSFDILEDARSRISQLSIKKKKSKRRLPKVSDSISSDSEPDCVEATVPGLDKKDEKTYCDVQKIIQSGQVDKLKVDQCKIYLRKHNLRLTGIKDILIKRIKEHLDIVSGGGESKYPVSSFVMNCKGDACTGDVVLFEQKVYDMYSIVSRSATGPPCGTRTIAGRIIKESYGSAKQQHTFTIEVLWSKGEKPVPPLHPLLIKGRNLYRLNTLRQKWDDEGERQKTLQEKHSRGYSARTKRETRIQRKETSKTLKTTNRASERGVETIQEQMAGGKENNHTFHANHRQFSNPSYVPPPLRDFSTNIERFNHTNHANYRQSSNSSYVPPPMRDFNTNNIERFNQNTCIQSSSSSYQGLPWPPPCVPPARNIPYGLSQRQNHFVPGGMFQGKQHMKKDVCRHYNRGKCSYGENCRYLHEKW